MYNLILFEETV